MFLVPHGITIDPANNVFLTDVGLQQVFKFSHDGALMFASASRASANGTRRISTNRPTSPSAPDGSFYVSDGYVNSRVAIFDRNGKWLQEWGKKGAGDGEFSNPHGLTFVTGSTDVIVADRENSRLQLFDRIGVFKRQWAGATDAQTTGRVFSVATDPDGAFYVGIRRADYDSAHTGVLKLDRDWQIVTAVGFGKPGDPVFNAVHDLAIGRDGSIYVAETRTKRVVKLRPVTVPLAVYWPSVTWLGFAPLPRRSFHARRGRILRRVRARCRVRAAQPRPQRRQASRSHRCARDARHLLRHVPQPAAQDRRTRARHRRRRHAARECGSLGARDREAARRLDAAGRTAAARCGDVSIGRRVARSRTSIARGSPARTRAASTPCIGSIARSTATPCAICLRSIRWRST